MSYRPKREKHGMDVCALFFGARYVTCSEVGCMRVLRARGMRHLINKGGKP